MRKYLLGIGAAAIVALTAGCGDHESAMDHTATQSADSAQYNDQDISFAQGMIPHHQQAVDMSKLAAEKATDAKVKDLAARIEAAQGPEIEQLTGMLDEWGATAAHPSTSDMPGMDHGGMSGEGMMTDEEMAQLDGATGADFDRLWVRLMIKHHEGAVAMAKTELERGKNADAKALAQTIIDAQEAEITEMRAM